MTSTAVRAERRARAGFVVLGSIEFLTVMDASVVNIALPVLQEDLGLRGSAVSWVVTCYLIPFAGMLLLAGRLGDVLGHRRLFLAGTGLFTLASAGCALASESWQLLVGRAVQGAGAALVVPAALALIATLFADGPQRHRALAILGGMGGIAAPVGLVLGGLLADIDWSWIFWVNVPLGVVVLLLARRVLPKPPRTPARLDVLGGVAATAAVALLALAVASLADPLPVPGAWAAAGALVCAAIVVWRQRTAAEPLIPRGLLRRRSVAVGGALFVVVGTILLATFYVVTLYLQQVRGLSPSAATVAYLPLPLAMFAGTQLAPRLLRRVTPRNVLGAGLVIQSLSLALWAQTSTASGSLVTALLLPALPWAFALGLSIVTSFVVCTNGIPASAAGAASGLATSAYQGGGAVGLALIAALAAATSERLGNTATAELAGHHWALWVLAVLAVLGALGTRALPGPPSGTVPS